MRGWFFNNTVRWVLPMLALAVAAPLALGDAPTPAPPTAAAPAPLMGPPAPTLAPAAQANDLNPRPLGAAREPKATPDAPGASQPSAAAVLWENPAIRTGGSLVFVLVLIVGLAAITKKVAGKSGTLASALGPGGKAPAGLLEVLGRYPLSRGQTLILLKVDQRVLLLAQTTSRLRGGAGGAGSLSTLCEITDAEEVASILVKAGEHEGTGATAKFSALLHAFDRSHKQDAGEADHTEIDLRTVQQTESGDRAELWDERATPHPLPPVVHKFPAAAAASRPAAAQVADAYAQSVASAGAGPESFSSIRQRLHALRGEAHR